MRAKFHMLPTPRLLFASQHCHRIRQVRIPTLCWLKKPHVSALVYLPWWLLYETATVPL